MKKTLIIKADTNDADYIENSTDISDEQYEQIIPIIEAICKIGKRDHNYETGEMINKYDAEYLYGHLEGFETFNKMVPYGEYGIHTIVSIKIIFGETKELL